MSGTMKVKLNTSMSGHRQDVKGRHVGDYVYNSGDVVDLPADEAKRLIDRGSASPVQQNQPKN